MVKNTLLKYNYTGRILKLEIFNKNQLIKVSESFNINYIAF